MSSRKLNLEVAEEIRRRYKNRAITQKALADEYRVSTFTINSVLNYYTHVPEGMGRRGRKTKPKAVLHGPLNVCLCGCGGVVGKPGTKHLPGHAMRHHAYRYKLTEHDRPERTDADFLAATLAECTEVQLGYKSPCMIWQGKSRIAGGYVVGVLRGYQTTRHRLVYQASRGFSRLPREVQIDHVCAHSGGTGGKLHRRCMNPEHLAAVSAAENMQASGSWLNPELVREMRRLRSDGWTLVALGERYNMAPNSIAQICKRHRWKNVL